MSSNGQMGKQSVVYLYKLYIYITEYYLTIEKNEILTQATTEINLGNIVGSEKEPVTKVHILCNFHSHENPE